MFAKRSAKLNKNKRRRVTDDEDGDASGKRSSGARNSDGEHDDEQLIAPIVTDRRKINTFSVRLGPFNGAQNTVLHVQ